MQLLWNRVSCWVLQWIKSVSGFLKVWTMRILWTWHCYIAIGPVSTKGLKRKQNRKRMDLLPRDESACLNDLCSDAYLGAHLCILFNDWLNTYHRNKCCLGWKKLKMQWASGLTYVVGHEREWFALDFEYYILVVGNTPFEMLIL